MRVGPSGKRAASDLMSAPAPEGSDWRWQAQADREQRQLLVLDQVVADHHEAGGEAAVLVDDAAAVVTGKFLSSLVVRPSQWDGSPGGGRRMSAAVGAERRGVGVPESQPMR
jgi:hypothetical protein